MNGDLRACNWSHASRTDKGVHAVGQCVALQLPGENGLWFGVWSSGSLKLLTLVVWGLVVGEPQAVDPWCL